MVFIADMDMLNMVASDLLGPARKLARRFWPGELTLLVEPSQSLNPKVVKLLTMANGRIGVRVPCDDTARAVVSGLGRPMLVSSANVAKKKGSESAAQVIKNFMGKVDLFVNAGDLKKPGSSTVVRVDEEGFTVQRPGIISDEEIRAALEDG